MDIRKIIKEELLKEEASDMTVVEVTEKISPTRAYIRSKKNNEGAADCSFTNASDVC